MRSTRSIAALLCAVGLAGCGSGLQAGGAPTSVSGPSAAVTPTIPAPATAALKPCSLLTAKDVARFGTFKPAEVENLGGARTCAYHSKLKAASDCKLADQVVDTVEGRLPSA